MIKEDADGWATIQTKRRTQNQARTIAPPMSHDRHQDCTQHHQNGRVLRQERQGNDMAPTTSIQG